MQQDAEGPADDLDIAPDQPMLEMLQICLEPVTQIVLVQCRTAKTANIRMTAILLDVIKQITSVSVYFVLPNMHHRLLPKSLSV